MTLLTLTSSRNSDSLCAWIILLLGAEFDSHTGQTDRYKGPTHTETHKCLQAATAASALFRR